MLDTYLRALLLETQAKQIRRMADDLRAAGFAAAAARLDNQARELDIELIAYNRKRRTLTEAA